MLKTKTMTKLIDISVIIVCSVGFCVADTYNGKYNDVFTWKQLGYDFDGMLYRNSTDFEYKPDAIHFIQELNDSEKFFIQSNNIPIGFEVYGDKVFITVPRRRHGIPSTLNYVQLNGDPSPLLKPYRDAERSKHFVSVYRPRVDACDRLWMVDTGHLEVPGERRQIQSPAIIIYDLKTNKEILRHELNPSIIINERTTAGLTSITVDVDPRSCGTAFAYINDLATEGLVVFSLEDKESWRVRHDSFIHDEQAVNFTAAGHILNWKDGLFSIALSPPDGRGRRKAYYHPLVSTQEFAVDTAVLKSRGSLDGQVQHLGSRGPNTQSGSHDVHASTGAMFFANVAQDAIMCWNVEKNLKNAENVVVVARDPKKLGYISDLKVSGDEVWVLTNHIPRFVFNTMNRLEDNFFIQRYKVYDLIKGTACEKPFKKKI